MRKNFLLVILLLSLNSSLLFAQSITCPANITIYNTSAPFNQIVSYSTPTATDEILGFPVPVATTLVNGPASGSAFPLGTTTVTWQAEFPCANPPICTQTTITCIFTVTVLPPIVY